VAFAVTLEKMARGGVYDQLAGGFHRYSVDERWVVPHFEKMLYDNAELLRNYVHGFQSFVRQDFLETARQIVDWLDTTMTIASAAASTPRRMRISISTTTATTSPGLWTRQLPCSTRMSWSLPKFLDWANSATCTTTRQERAARKDDAGGKATGGIWSCCVGFAIRQDRSFWRRAPSGHSLH